MSAAITPSVDAGVADTKFVSYPLVSPAHAFQCSYVPLDIAHGQMLSNGMSCVNKCLTLERHIARLNYYFRRGRMANNYNEDISNNLNDIRKTLELILAEMRRRNEREEAVLALRTTLLEVKE